MASLLLRLAGPIQAWGCESKYNKRLTWRAPSKSAVIGLVAAALGRSRTESLEDLSALRFGLREDRGGLLLRDFQTTMENGRASNVIEKYYLSDAVFLAGLEGDDALLREIDSAIARPAFPLFLGRRSCPTEGRVSLGLRGASLEDALAAEPCLVERKDCPGLRIYIESRDVADNAYFQRDDPLSFDPEHRQYGYRRVREYIVAFPPAAEQTPPVGTTEHDAMAELEG